jgi:hypothetical protein
MSVLRLDDNLFERTAEAAAAQGLSVEAFVTATLRAALANDDLVRTTRNGVPVIVVGPAVPAIDPQTIRDSLEEDGL